jgi:SWI/SNF-related matrix-associated actin-dependent regulator 1 of chromatin subfamily A
MLQYKDVADSGVTASRSKCWFLETEVSSPDAASDAHPFFPYQLEGIRFAMERRGTLLADEPGLGKSAQAIGVINADPTIQSVVIICPAVMRLPWKRELLLWITREYSIGIIGIDQDAAYSDIVIVNYDRLATPWLQDRRRQDLVIIDECHYCKNPRSQRTRRATSFQAPRQLALSGTPLLNNPVELPPILSWLDPITWPRSSWFDFSQKYGGAIYTGFRWEYKGGTNLDELSTRLRSSVMIRRTKQEVLPELPDKLRSIIELQPGADIAQLVKAELDAFEQFEAAVGSHADGYDQSVKSLQPACIVAWEYLATVRRQTAEAKVPYVVEFVSETLAAGIQKLVVWAHHRSVALSIQAGLSAHSPVLVLGGMKPKDRQAAIDEFQTNPDVRVFVGGITAAGLGITLTSASHCVFAELSWVPAEMSQAEDRLHRIGQHDSVLVQHLVLTGSLDSIMARRLFKKQKIVTAVLDPQNGHFTGIPQK